MTLVRIPDKDMWIEHQWPFREPKLEVPTVRFISAYFLGSKNSGKISPQIIWPKKWYVVSSSICWILEFSHCGISEGQTWTKMDEVVLILAMTQEAIYWSYLPYIYI